MLHGLSSTVDHGAGDLNAQECLDTYPQSVVAVGLPIVDPTGKNLDHIADGTHDGDTDERSTFIQAAKLGTASSCLPSLPPRRTS